MRDCSQRHIPPTIFHVTHWKAGSQWVRSILKHAAPRRFVQARPGAEGPIGGPVMPGAIYSPVYTAAAPFRAAVPAHPSHRTFVVIRDPRDTLISWYFSLMYSHAPDEPTVQESRDELRRLSKSDGLALMIRKHLNEVMWIQREWVESGAAVFRYEELRADQQNAFQRIFEFCELDVSDPRRRRIVRRHSFIRRTWWRLGREDVRSYLRKGAVGDWRHHFDDELKRLFKSLHGETLVSTGYEPDDAW
jgi:Sulfotransferase domain